MFEWNKKPRFFQPDRVQKLKDKNSPDFLAFPIQKVFSVFASLRKAAE